MRPLFHVWPQEGKNEDGWVTHSARLEDENPFTLWFKAREEDSDLLCARAESFAAGAVMLAMLRGRELRVHAPLSPSFLRNLEELQALWSCWDPAFKTVGMEADGESESAAQAPGRAISTFSGGVDSCFTAWRHTQKTCGRRALPLQTSIMIHGSEFLLERESMFEQGLARSQRMLSAVNVRLVRMATNFRFVMPYDFVWRGFGSMLAGALLLFQESHAAALIPASFTYDGLILPCSTSPLNDPLYSTARFAIEHDGAHASRTAKMKEIIAWPGVLENLRVCNHQDYAHVNCCRCEKCVRNILTLRILGVQNPSCFPRPLSDEDIDRVNGMSPSDIELMRCMVEDAHEAQVQDSWLAAAERCIRRNERRSRPLRLHLKERTPKAIWRIGQAVNRKLRAARGLPS